VTHQTTSLQQIRRLQPSEASQLEGWSRGLQFSPQFNWTPASLAATLEGNVVLGLFRESEMISGLAVQGRTSDWEILWLATHPQHRRRGLMRQLLEHLVDNARRQERSWGCTKPDRVLLEVHFANKTALNLYQSLGFSEVGRRKNYYSDGGEARVFGLKLK
jgi:ribosomal-protein-alanine N-acetyltransferase